MELAQMTRSSNLDWSLAAITSNLYKLHVPKLHVLPG